MEAQLDALVGEVETLRGQVLDQGWQLIKLRNQLKELKSDVRPGRHTAMAETR